MKEISNLSLFLREHQELSTYRAILCHCVTDWSLVLRLSVIRQEIVMCNDLAIFSACDQSSQPTIPSHHSLWIMAVPSVDLSCSFMPVSIHITFHHLYCDCYPYHFHNLYCDRNGMQDSWHRAKSEMEHPARFQVRCLVCDLEKG